MCCATPGSHVAPICPAPVSPAHSEQPPLQADLRNSLQGPDHQVADRANPRSCHPPCRSQSRRRSGLSRATRQGWSPMRSTSVRRGWCRLPATNSRCGHRSRDPSARCTTEGTYRRVGAEWGGGDLCAGNRERDMQRDIRSTDGHPRRLVGHRNQEGDRGPGDAVDDKIMPNQHLLIAGDGSEHIDGLAGGQGRGGRDGDGYVRLSGYRDKIITSQDVVDKQASRKERVNGRWTVHFEIEVCGRSSNLNQLDVVNAVWSSCRDVVGDDPNRDGLRRIGLLCVDDQTKNHDDHRAEKYGSNEPSTTHTMIPSPEHHPAARQERA